MNIVEADEFHWFVQFRSTEHLTRLANHLMGDVVCTRKEAIASLERWIGHLIGCQQVRCGNAVAMVCFIRVETLKSEEKAMLMKEIEPMLKIAKEIDPMDSIRKYNDEVDKKEKK